ncbi:MAG TPA: hypothetical protein VEY09_16360 [Pyrinomonadaceae bacterium]|nr:hypothetical protein [Pyrinomonadaceae bacterium]
MIQSHIRALACLTLLFCCTAREFSGAAQNSEVLSKRPLVLRIFDPDKNESKVTALLINPSEFAYPANRPSPDIRLHSVEYTYPGNVPSRPQAIAFVLIPADKNKTAPSFSVAADDTVLHQGEATLREMCCVEVNGHKANPQHIVVSMPLEILERLTQAKKIELKLKSKRGEYSFKLNDYARKCLTALAHTIK